MTAPATSPRPTASTSTASTSTATTSAAPSMTPTSSTPSTLSAPSTSSSAAPMTAGAGTAYSARIPQMHAGSQSLLSTVSQGLQAAQELESLVLDVLKFAGIGSTVGAANTTMQAHQVSAMSSLMQGMQKVGQLVGQVATAYTEADQAISKAFGGQSRSGADATSTAQPGGGGQTSSPTTPPAGQTSDDPMLQAAGTHHYGDSGAEVTALQQKLNAAGYSVGSADGHWGIATQAALAQYAHDHNLTMPTQPNQLDQRAVDLILNAEGNNRNFTQGGRHEIYGIREGNVGYAGVNAASQQFGQNSAGERAAATQVVQNAYNNAGFTGFTDAGEQAAIASAIHMRGPGGGSGVQGTSAIIHGMATGQTDAHTAATPQDVQTVQNMNPDQFQTAFRSAREAYDHDAYGNTTTNHGGTRENWWTAYGRGLQTRYDNEERQFRALSGN